MKAWLITWEGTDSAITTNNKLVGIVNFTEPDKTISGILEFIYQRSFGSAVDMLYAMDLPEEKLRATTLGSIINGIPHKDRIYCGSSSSFLYARRVTELRVEMDEEKGLETITWDEPVVYKGVGQRVSVCPEIITQSISRSLSKCLSIDLFSGTD